MEVSHQSANDLPAINGPVPISDGANDTLVSINNMHGVAIDSQHVIRQISNNLKNKLAVVAGRSQSLANRSANQAQQRLAKQIGRAQDAVDNAVGSMSSTLHSAIEQAAIPVIELGGELPSRTMVAVAKSQLPTLQPFERISPVQTYIPPTNTGCAPSGPPPAVAPGFCAVPVCDPAIGPYGGWEIQPGPCDTLPSGGGGGGGGPCPPGMIPSNPGSIDNVCVPPICPPCPPKDCPPCPSDGCMWSIYRRPCQEGTDTCCYALPAGVNPLGPGDVLVENVPDSMGGPVCRAIAACNEGCGDVPVGSLVCPGPQPPAGGGGVGGGQPPGGCAQPQPFCGQCPPGMHLEPGPNGLMCVPDQPGMPAPPNCPPGTVPIWMPVGPGAGPADGSWNCIPQPSSPSTPGQPPPVAPPYPIMTPPGFSVTINGGLGFPPEQFPEGGQDILQPIAAIPAPGNICNDWDAWAQQWQGKDCFEMAAELGLGRVKAGLGEANGEWGIFKFIPYIWSRMLVFGMFIMTTIFVAWCSVVDTILSVACPNRGPLIYLALLRWSMAWLKRIAGVSDRKPEEQLQKMENYFCPTGTPVMADANLAFMKGDIDEEYWKCLVRMCNMAPAYAQMVLTAGRDMPNAFDYINYWRRGKSTEQELNLDLSHRGFLVSRDRDILREVTTIVPPPTDLVRFMLRSIGDPAVVAQFQLEDEFNILFQGRIKTWATANGITEDVLRGYHAAHWGVPSPGDLATFWQRYGPGRTLPADGSIPRNMTDADYNRALREQAIPPFWRPFYRNTQYNILGFRQIQQGYQYGQLNDHDVVNRFLDIGYRDEDAIIMRNIAKQRAINAWTKDDIVRAYIRNGVNVGGLQSYLQSNNLSHEIVQVITDNAKREAQEVATEKVISSIEKAYDSGQMDNNQLQVALEDLELDPDQIERIVATLQQAKDARPKPIAASMICQWYTNHWISRDEALTRLTNSGYLARDAELIVLTCEMKYTAQQAKQYQAYLTKLSNQERRNLKQLNAEQRQAQLASQRQAKALGKQIRDQQTAQLLLLRSAGKAQLQIDKALSSLTAAEKSSQSAETKLVKLYQAVGAKWWKKNGGEPQQIMADLVTSVNAAIADGLVPATEVLAVANQLLADSPKGQWDRIADLISLARDQVVQVLATNSGQQANGNSPVLSKE